MPVTLDEILKKVMDSTGLSKDEIQKELQAIIKEFENFIDEESAAHYLAQKHGIELFERVVERNRQIKELIPDMRNVTLPVKILSILGVREFTKKNGDPGMVANLLVGDETGKIRLVTWDNHANHIAQKDAEVNDVLMIAGGYTKTGRYGDLEIHVGNRGSLQVNPPEVTIDIKETYTSPISYGEVSAGEMGQSIEGLVEQVYPLHTFTRSNKSEGKTMSLILREYGKKKKKIKPGDHTLRLVCWDEKAVEIQEAKLGDLVRVDPVIVREGKQGGLETHSTSSSLITISPGIPDYVGSEPVNDSNTSPSSDITPRSIASMTKPDPNVSLIGLVANTPTTRKFKRKDGSEGELLSMIIGDDTGAIHLVLWDEHARNHIDVKKNDLVQIEHAYSRVGFKGEMELNLGKRGIIFVNPKGVEGPSISEIQQETLAPILPHTLLHEAVEKQQIRTIAAITRFFSGTLVYPACPKCRKKVTPVKPPSEKEWTCRECGKVGVEWTPLLSGIIDDGSSSMRFSMFGETAGKFLGKSGKEIHAMLQEESGEEAVLEPIEQAYLGNSIDFVGRITRNSQSGRLELQIRSWHPIEYSRIISSTLEELDIS